jgi:hypothetical protein
MKPVKDVPTMRKPPKNTIRAYGIASYLNATLKAYEVKDAELELLGSRSAMAMKVFHAKCGLDLTIEISEMFAELWQDMAKYHSATISSNSIPSLVEGFCLILPPKEFKDFFGIQPYVSKHNEEYGVIMKSVNELNHRLNVLLGTKSVSMTKPKQKISKPTKKREKSKKQKKHELEVQQIQNRKLRVKSFLRDRIKNAKETI